MSDSRPTTYEPGDMCAKFRIERLLGRGGMGEVYLALDTFLGRRVALKVLPFKRSLDPTFRDRMQREAAAGARIDHPNVTKILDGGATDNHVFYVVMEFLEEMRTLRALCHNQRLRFDSSLIIAIQIAEGVSAIHAAGIIHRDLKPENVAVLPGGVVKIIDFGLAKVRSEWIRTSFDPSQPQARMGTAHYMAPEQIDNRKDDIGTRSDVYSLGCILFEVFSGGRHIFQRASDEFPEQMAAVYAHVHRIPPRLDDEEISPLKDIPASLADLVARCLSKKVEERPEADEIGRELRRILEAVKAQPPSVVIASGAATARTAVPTDAVNSQGISIPRIELPHNADLSSAPGARTSTPESWEMRISPPRGFAPVLVTEMLPDGARPTMASPQDEDAVGPRKYPQHTVRMNPEVPSVMPERMSPPPQWGPMDKRVSAVPASIPTAVDSKAPAMSGPRFDNARRSQPLPDPTRPMEALQSLHSAVPFQSQPPRIARTLMDNSRPSLSNLPSPDVLQQSRNRSIVIAIAVMVPIVLVVAAVVGRPIWQRYTVASPTSTASASEPAPRAALPSAAPTASAVAFSANAPPEVSQTPPNPGVSPTGTVRSWPVAPGPGHSLTKPLPGSHSPAFGK